MITSLAVRDFADRPLHEVVLEAAAEAERSGLTVVRDVAVVAPPARDVHTAVCLVVREAVRNAVRHGQADTLTLRLADERDEVVLEVVDDGQGFDPATTTTAQDGHLGLTLYRHAARTTGGTSTLDTVPGTGTRLVFRAPRDRSARLRRHRG